KVFQWLHPADPMTYSVNGLRAMTVGGVDARFWIACAVLLGLILVSLVATSLSARRNRQYNMERLYPPVLISTGRRHRRARGRPRCRGGCAWGRGLRPRPITGARGRLGVHTQTVEPSRRPAAPLSTQPPACRSPPWPLPSAAS